MRPHGRKRANISSPEEVRHELNRLDSEWGNLSHSRRNKLIHGVNSAANRAERRSEDRRLSEEERERYKETAAEYRRWVEDHKSRKGDEIHPGADMIHRGALERHGYNEEEGPARRHEALRKAVEQDGYARTVERINALAVVNKGHEQKHRELESDLKWLREEYR